MQVLIDLIMGFGVWLSEYLDVDTLIWAAIGLCIGLYLDLKEQIEELEKKNHG